MGSLWISFCFLTWIVWLFCFRWFIDVWFESNHEYYFSTVLGFVDRFFIFVGRFYGQENFFIADTIFEGDINSKNINWKWKIFDIFPVKIFICSNFFLIFILYTWLTKIILKSSKKKISFRTDLIFNSENIMSFKENHLIMLSISFLFSNINFIPTDLLFWPPTIIILLKFDNWTS